MKIKKIFLASSEELKNDRLAFERMIRRLNQQWRLRGFIFDLVIWESFIDSMFPDGLQKAYNQAVAECDIFVMMFFTKVGLYTLEEFEKAVAGMKADTGPRIYTYFRNDFILTGDIDESIISLLDFKAKLKSLDHYVTEYRNTEDLQWQFSRQLEMLYGNDDISSLQITDSTTKTKIGEAAIILSYRQIFDSNELSQVDVDNLKLSLHRAGKQVRNAVFRLANDVRRENWATDKYLMERTIPIFEALVQVDHYWHVLHGQLGYALKDRLVPNWKRAKESLDKAVELRGERTDEGIFYQYNRALCAINLDANYISAHKPADQDTRSDILNILKQAKHDLKHRWDRMLEEPESATIRFWLKVNDVNRLR